MVAPGGISLKMPKGQPVAAVGTDPSVVDLRDLTEAHPTVFQEPWTNVALGRVLRRKIEVPIPRRIGEVGRAMKGERIAAAIRVPPPGAVCDEGAAVALHEELVRARALALRLQGIENAINMINARNVARQEAFETTAQELGRAREDFVDNLYDVLTQGLISAHSALDGRKIPSSLDEMNQAATVMREAKETLGTVKDRLDQLKLAFDTARADDMETRNRVAGELLDLAKDTFSGAKITGSGTPAAGMRAALRTLNGAQRVIDVLEFGEPLVTLGFAMVRLGKAGPRTEQELKALTDRLLPLQRDLSDRLDAALRSPAVQDWLAGKADVACGPAAEEPPADVSDPLVDLRPEILDWLFDVRILRVISTEGCTMGQLYVNGELVSHALELPWKGNAPEISSIPPGTYDAILRYDHADRWRMELTGVPGRTHIQFHVGNCPSDTKGCLLVGSASYPERCVLDGGTSRPAYNKLKAAFYGSDEPTYTPNKMIRITIAE